MRLYLPETENLSLEDIKDIEDKIYAQGKEDKWRIEKEDNKYVLIKKGDKKMEKKQITAINLNPENGFCVLNSGCVIENGKDLAENSYFVGISEKELLGIKNRTHEIVVNKIVKKEIKMETNLIIVYKNYEVVTMHLSDGDSVVLDFENDVRVKQDDIKVVKYDFNKNSDNFVSTLVNIHRCCMGQKITMKHKGEQIGEFNWAKTHGGDIMVNFKCDDKILSVSGDIEI